MPRKLFFLIVVISASVLALPGQAPAPAEYFDKDVATVYLYRIDYDPFIYSFVFSRRLSVKFAETSHAPKDLPQIASLRKNRYAVLKLKPGSYLFDTRMMNGKLKLDVAAGEVRYLRWDQGKECGTEDINDPFAPGNNCEGRGAGIFEMETHVGYREIKKMKPIGRGDVKDRGLVIIPGK